MTKCDDCGWSTEAHHPSCPRPAADALQLRQSLEAKAARASFDDTARMEGSRTAGRGSFMRTHRVEGNNGGVGE
jgi:hypothetical protein